MIKVTSQFTLPQKLRAHADNVGSYMGPHTDAAWVMRDAANIIEALEQRMIKLEEAYDDVNNRARKVGTGEE
jgi:hypothetical protein